MFRRKVNEFIYYHNFPNFPTCSLKTVSKNMPTLMTQI